MQQHSVVLHLCAAVVTYALAAPPPAHIKSMFKFQIAGNQRAFQSQALPPLWL